MIFKASFYLKIMCPKIEIPSNKKQTGKKIQISEKKKRRGGMIMTELENFENVSVI
jgi:hypothetical protein